MATHAVRFYDYHPPANSFRAEVLAGLNLDPKRIAPKFFYDVAGSRLFDAICDLPEYYPTRTEIGILKGHAREISRLTGPNCLLIELGSGNSSKVRLLLEALQPAAYLPMDISRDHLLRAANILAADYPWLAVHATCIDYSQRLDIPYFPDDLRKVAFFPGSSIGNFEPDDTLKFLSDVARALGAGGAMLIGVDLKKDPALLHAAYNDSRGITAQFNLNLLARINRELGGNFMLENFEHHAFYNEVHGRIEMHLVSRCKQTVRICDRNFDFSPGENLHTENSYKFDPEEFKELARAAGFQPLQMWTDPQGLFSVHYLGLPPC